jgi:CHAT domain-containing protein
LPPRVSIEELAFRTVTRFGAILDRRRSPEAQAAFEADLRRLSNVLLGPLAGLPLPKRLILVLDGVLNRVPMAALRPPGAREALGLNFELIHAPSAAYLLAATPPKSVPTFRYSVLAVADPVFGADDPRAAVALGSVVHPSSLPRLPFANEIAALKSFIAPARIRIVEGFDAAPRTLRNLNLGAFAVLHFSTHAFIDDRIPELSRVALSLVDRTGHPVDGYLRPFQFSEFRLDHSIVVLSSCDSALGKEVIGEGLVGFASSLFSAGASQLVLTVANVDAESSSVFFEEVYRHFFGTRAVGMESAIMLARRALVRSSRWSDPYYWASFTVIGSPSAIQ